MVNPLAIWRNNGKAQRLQNAKDRILKQRGPILDAFAENIKGARTCPLYMGGPCVGGLCEFFGEYKNVNDKGEQVVYHRCNINQTPQLLIENANLTRALINEKRKTQKLLIAIYEKQHGEVKT